MNNCAIDNLTCTLHVGRRSARSARVCYPPALHVPLISPIFIPRNHAGNHVPASKKSVPYLWNKTSKWLEPCSPRRSGLRRYEGFSFLERECKSRRSIARSCNSSFAICISLEAVYRGWRYLTFIKFDEIICFAPSIPGKLLNIFPCHRSDSLYIVKVSIL